MADHGGGRRLAAILAADVVGYSRLMAADEAGTHARLKALRKQFIEPKIAEHHGRLVKLTGDGALVEIAPDRQIQFRVGVNLGDVIFDEDDLYGDGVNVAARLEALAEPGSVCISAKVHDEVKNKLGFGYQDLGPQTVKNIPDPVRAYRVLMEPGATGTLVGPPAAVVHGKRPIAWRIPALAAAVASIIIAVGLVAWLRSGQTAPHEENGSLDPHRVAVLPFVNISAVAAEEYFSDGMTEELITQLSKIGRLSVIARTSIMKYKGTKADIAEIGRALQVGTILEGSVRKAGNQVRITAQLIDVKSQAHLWSEDYDRALNDVFAVQGDIAKQVAEELQITLLAKEQAQIEKQHTADLEAYNSYLRGLHFYNQGGVAWEKSRTYFEQAIQRDPSYAMAYARLADLYTKMWWSMPHQEAYVKARAAAEKALELDDTLAEAHSALAIVKLYADWDWPGAEREFQRAIALNPSSALAHSEYGHKLLSPVMGRYDDALAEVRRAQELDPLSVSISTEIAWVYHHARRWDQSIAQFQRTIELGSKSPWPHVGLGQDYALTGRYAEAIAAVDEAVALAGNSPYFQGVRGWILGLAGRTDEAQQMLPELEKTAAGEEVDPIAFAWIYMGLGDHDHAIAWLQKAYKEHSTEMIFLRTPTWDSLRSNPRFIALMKDVGLPTD
jgi:adenylate cyclase